MEDKAQDNEHMNAISEEQAIWPRTDYLKSGWVETCLGRTDGLHTRLQAVESLIEIRGRLLDEIVLNVQRLQGEGPRDADPDVYEYTDAYHYDPVSWTGEKTTSVVEFREQGYTLYEAHAGNEGPVFLMRRPRREAHYLCTECGTTDYMKHYAGYACRPADYDGSR